MTQLGLFFIGAVLLINGTALLGHTDAKGAAPINLFVGTFLLVIAGWILLPVTGTGISDLPTLVSAGGLILFGFTYLYVGILNYTGHPGIGLGWFCGWAALVSAGVAIINFVEFNNTKIGLLWFMWTVLFAAFFLVLAVEKKNLTTATGWLTVVVSFTSCTIPGALMILGRWSSTPESIVLGMTIITILVFLVGVLKSDHSGSSSAILKKASR